MAKMARKFMAKVAKNNVKNGEKMFAIFAIIAKRRESVRHFRHHGENGKKIDGENGEFFSAIFAMAKMEKK